MDLFTASSPECTGGAVTTRSSAAPAATPLHGDDGNDTLFGRDGEADFLAGGFGADTAERDATDTTNGVERFV